MWFAKLLGGREVKNAAPKTTHNTAVFTIPANKLPKNISAPNFQLIEDEPPAVTRKKVGFDPYNSGAFDRTRGWDRITRK